jgi:hypothetical protein
MNKTKPIYYCIAGMLAGGMAGFFLFYHLDQSKGWNPYGWWFPATFVAAVAGGIAGVFLGGISRKEQPKK